MTDTNIAERRRRVNCRNSSKRSPATFVWTRRAFPHNMVRGRSAWLLCRGRRQAMRRRSFDPAQGASGLGHPRRCRNEIERKI
jgi:hypothetical protein